MASFRTADDISVYRKLCENHLHRRKSQFQMENFICTFLSHKRCIFPIFKDFHTVRIYFCLHLHFILRIWWTKIHKMNRWMYFTDSKRMMCYTVQTVVRLEKVTSILKTYTFNFMVLNVFGTRDTYLCQ